MLNNAMSWRLSWMRWVSSNAGKMELFSSASEPTSASHGDRFAACIGPFRTKRGAVFMARHGLGNPHCVTVADAERLAKKYR
jgi:hypothetical protein